MATPVSNGDVSPVSPSGTDAFNALLTSYKWGGPVGTAATLTYSFRTSASFYSTTPDGYGSSTGGDGEPWQATWYLVPPAQQTAISQALSRWAEVANLTFNAFTDSASVAGDLRFGYATDLQGSDSRPAWAYLPDATPKAGDVWFDESYYSDFDDAQAGSYGVYIFLHEIGHALGLKHTHEGANTIPLDFDSAEYSVMSYRDYVGDNTDSMGSALLPDTPMVYDIAAIQYLYGANMTTRAGNTVYSWGVGEKIYETIWDAGGIDTIDWSNQVTDAVINLNEGGLSEIGPARSNTSGTTKKNLGIAFDVTIENAKGGSGDDTLFGNNAPNVLNGGAGADALVGAAGNDTLIHSPDGVDLAGTEVEHAGSPGYAVTGEIASTAGTYYSLDYFDGGGGTDTLLGNDGAENLVLDYIGLDDPTITGIEVFDVRGGNDIVDLTSQRFTYGSARLLGGAGNDVLWSNAGADTLDGGAGSDTMLGSAGNDTYMVNAPGDVVRELSNQGIDTVKSSVSEVLSNHVDKLILTGTTNINGTGNPLANTLTGNSGKNILDGKGGADKINGGNGNDMLIWGSGDTVNGGAGIDTLKLSVNLNLVSLLNNKILNVETINMTGGGNDTLTLATGDVLALSSTTDTIKILGNAGDIVNIDRPTLGTPTEQGDYFRYKFGDAILLIHSNIEVV